MTDVPTLLSELDALAAKATPGPWAEQIVREIWRGGHASANDAGMIDTAAMAHALISGQANTDARYISSLANAYPLLRAEILRLREALEPFALGADDWDDNYTDGCAVDRFRLGKQTVGDLRRARAALKGSEGGE